MLMPETLDLFSGAVGGWSLGMHRAGFRTVAACEADPWRRAVYAHNNPGIPIYDDVRTVTADRLRIDLGELPPVIVGSPPCQDASSANTKGRGVDGERTGLFFEAIRIVRECRPRWAAFENSPMLRTRGYDRLYDAFQQAGYACWPLVVGADDLEAPHKRKRVWIIAFNAEGVRPLCWRSWRHRLEGIAGASASRHDPDADIDPGRVWAPPSNADRDGVAGQRAAEAPEESGHRQTANADSTGSSLGESLGGHARAQFEALERAVGPAVHAWNGGVARHLGMAHGLAARLADIRVPDHKYPGATINAAKACISAHGDAILPQIAEAIGRSILRTEAALAAVSGH